MLTLGDFNEGSLLHNIRERYKKDLIYTSVGLPIIISINPYKSVDIYTKNHMKKANVPPTDPHLFQIAENSYQSLLDNSKNQSIIISGESGAGKTEAAKIILKYLTNVSAAQVIFNKWYTRLILLARRKKYESINKYDSISS